MRMYIVSLEFRREKSRYHAQHQGAASGQLQVSPPLRRAAGSHAQGPLDRGRVRLGGITKAGDPGIRSTLIVGATALLRHVRKGRTRPSPWLAALLERKPLKLVVVALANKFARIAWRLMVSGGVYNRPPAPMPAALAA
jgi:hypothetical protein